MRIGVPKEIKNHEYRVGLIPSNVFDLCANGHEVVVETGAGLGIGALDSDYEFAGAKIENKSITIFEQCDMIVKVKEPQEIERALLRKDQILFTYLHLANDSEQTHDLMISGATCIAYETITSLQGGLPLLAPMSEVAGKLSIQAGAYYLQKNKGGIGILLGGVTGILPAKVVILGGGVVGMNAAKIAIGMGADVTLIDNNLEVLRSLSNIFGQNAKLLFSNTKNIEEQIVEADLLIAGVLIPGAAAPKLVTDAMVQKMKKGAVIVDVAIDQGGCCETSHATTHDNPTYEVHGVTHYCVANMPGAVPKSSSQALSNATYPYILSLANHGINALRSNPHFMAGLNIYRGKLTNPEVANALALKCIDAKSVLI